MKACHRAMRKRMTDMTMTAMARTTPFTICLEWTMNGRIETKPLLPMGHIRLAASTLMPWRLATLTMGSPQSEKRVRNLPTQKGVNGTRRTQVTVLRSNSKTEIVRKFDRLSATEDHAESHALSSRQMRKNPVHQHRPDRLMIAERICRVKEPEGVGLARLEQRNVTIVGGRIDMGPTTRGSGQQTHPHSPCKFSEHGVNHWRQLFPMILGLPYQYSALCCVTEKQAPALS